MIKYISKSPAQTKKFAQKFAKHLSGGEILAMVGDLGGGKTTFVQGLASGLNIKEKIKSPTFVILREYKIKNMTFVHADLYRITDVFELESCGLWDYITNPKNIIAIEWAEKIKKILPKSIIWIKFKFINPQTRQISIRGAEK